MFLHEEQNTYLTFTEFEAISPLFGGQTYLPIPPPRHILLIIFLKKSTIELKIFLTKLTGPGKVIVQTQNFGDFAGIADMLGWQEPEWRYIYCQDLF